MKAEFIHRVMQIMNELGWNDTQSDAFVGSDTTKVSVHIEAVFVDAWRKAVNILPKNYFEIEDFSHQKIGSNIPQGTGYVVLPSNFYKLNSFKMRGWQVAVERLIDSNDPLARLQANEYTRGNVVRPVCLRRSRGVRQRIGDQVLPMVMDVLEYYSLPPGSEQIVEEAFYIPLIEPLSQKTKLNDLLMIPLAYLCASLVFTLFEKNEIAQELEVKATQITY